MIYISYIFVLLILLIYERRMLSEKNVFRFLIPLVYVLFVGMRGANVGVDTPVYYQHYYIFGQWGCDFVEVGFDWLNRFCYHQGWSHVPFFVICASFAIIPVILVVNSCLTRKEYSIFIFLFCTTTFVSFCNGMRQNMACAIFFLLVCFFQESTKKNTYKLLVYILGIIFASLFHVSIYLVAPLILLNRVCLSNKKYICFYLISFVFVFINLGSVLPELEFGNRDYGKYLGGEMANTSASSLGFIVTSIRNFLLLILMIKINAFQKHTLLANMVYLLLVFTNVGFNIPIIGRINMYFNPFFLLFMALVTVDIKIRKRFMTQSLLFGLLIITLILSVYSIYSPANRVLPYTFYWENSSYTNYLEE